MKRVPLSAWPQHGLLALVAAYRYLISPWLGSACRFEPSCSRYAQQALQRHGASAGSYLAARRLLRCHPGCAGGHDPVPERPAWPWSRMPGAVPAPSPIEEPRN